jgi:hypothetical protein
MLRTRLSSPAGQVAAEYVGGLLLVAVVIAALLGGQLHTSIRGRGPARDLQDHRLRRVR